MLTILLMYKHCLKPICYSALYKLLEAALFCSSSLLCISNSNWTTENEPGRSVSVNGNEEPRWRDLSPIQFSSNSSYSLITHNKAPVHSTWGLLRVCAACPTPSLNLSCVLRPSWKNIQDTFHTGSAQDTITELFCSGFRCEKNCFVCKICSISKRRK